MLSFKWFFESLNIDVDKLIKNFVKQNSDIKKIDTNKKNVYRLRVDGDRKYYTNKLIEFLTQNDIQFNIINPGKSGSESSTTQTIVILLNKKKIKIVVKSLYTSSQITKDYELFIINILNKLANQEIVDIKKYVEDYILDFPKYKSYQNTFINVPKQILKFLKKVKINLNSHYIFVPRPENKKDNFQDNKIQTGYNLLKKLFKKANDLLKLEGFTKLNLNKWNPSDMFMINYSSISEIETQINNAKNIADLNTLLYNGYNNGFLMGFSLKKVSSNPNIKIMNLNKNSSLDFSTVLYGSGQKLSKDLLLTKDLFLISNNIKIQFRTFNIFKNYEGEIIGKTARLGKIGLTGISYIIKSLTGYDYEFFVNKLHSDIEKNNIEIHKNNFLQIASSLGFKYDENNINKKINDNDWFYSKYSAIKILDVIKSSLLSEFFTKIYFYASSQLDISSIFIIIK